MSERESIAWDADNEVVDGSVRNVVPLLTRSPLRVRVTAPLRQVRDGLRCNPVCTDRRLIGMLVLQALGLHQWTRNRLRPRYRHLPIRDMHVQAYIPSVRRRFLFPGLPLLRLICLLSSCSLLWPL